MACSRALLLASALALPGGAALAADADILSVVAASPCSKVDWPARGRAPSAFMKGMGLAYARTYCDFKTKPESVAVALAGSGFTPQSDALALYAKASGTPEERLRALYALAIGEGMRESSGNTTEGPDATVPHQTEEIAEAGLFQVSHDSIAASPWLHKLYAEYQADPSGCMLDVFTAGIKDKKRAVVGTGAGAEFQAFTKKCPAFAVEYAAVMFRTRLQHFGPIKRKEAQLLPVCEAMFREVEGKASCTGSGMNSTDASASAPGSLPAPAAAASASSSP